MIHYLLQLIGFQLLFLVGYDLFLKRETFFQCNRLYLLGTPLLSMVLPFLQFSAIQQAIPKEYSIQLPAVLIGNISTRLPVVALDGIAISEASSLGFSVFEIIIGIWAIGAVVAIILLTFKLVRLIRLRLQGRLTEVNGIQIRMLKETDIAFSFFNTIFIGEELSEAQMATIVLHERMHVKQLHSLDLLFFELLRVVFWFNPAVYAFQNRMVLLQEYIADANVAKRQDKLSYYQELLAQVFKTESISFINTFFNHSLIKKRITMLQKSKSKKIVQIKYLFLLPLIAGMLLYTACTETPESIENQVSQEYVTGGENSEIIQRVNDLLEAVAKKGNISKEEEDALRSLNVLTSEEGVNHSDFDTVKEILSLPIGVIEKVPTYPGCTGDNQALRECLSQHISTFVGSEFNTKVGGKEITGKQRVVVIFKIDITGKASEVRAKAAFPALEKEAVRVVSKLPQMLPGEQDGKAVGVMYSLPIVFEVSE
ncbi:MAG: bla regulator protein BlaR1 [Candidatus Latescibacterota bacterium]|jgi:bla regulator protein BlaR1